MNVSDRDVDADETAVAAQVGGDTAAAGPMGPLNLGAGRRAEEAGDVEVRYWAAARDAAGVDVERMPRPGTVAELLTIVAAERPALAHVLPVCSVLVDGRASRGTDVLRAGYTVEILPPFAGG
ncbi:MAG: MoaD/ThiS family protein [Dermatophilaceae bacterium]